MCLRKCCESRTLVATIQLSSSVSQNMEVTFGQYTAEPLPFINFHQSRSSSDDDDGDCQGNNFLGSADGHDGVRVILGHF